MEITIIFFLDFDCIYRAKVVFALFFLQERKE